MINATKLHLSTGDEPSRSSHVLTTQRARINLSFTSNTDETIGLMIMNTAGQLIMAESMNIDNGQVVSQLNSSDLAPGIYFATFMTAEGPVSHRFVKQ